MRDGASKGPQNLMSIYGIGKIPCDTSMRTILDDVDPKDLRPLFKDAFCVTIQRNFNVSNLIHEIRQLALKQYSQGRCRSDILFTTRRNITSDPTKELRTFF